MPEAKPPPAPLIAYREVSLGTRPGEEHEFVSPDDPQADAMHRIDALAFRRYLERAFSHPQPEMLRFEVRGFDVVALIAPGEGEVWFSEAAVPKRWDYVAVTEISIALFELERARLAREGHALPDAMRALIDQTLPTVLAAGKTAYDALESPEEIAQRRAAVIDRLRAANEKVRAVANARQTIVRRAMRRGR
ncbi:hypothetical protein [Cupriavidus plantarum]|uniref:hypothetical protein n=1 Tax=Cupriavidus plantarum TaxID=942865 RepID=UPI001B2DC1ED|nr:hypothetical protein [Cupriavidus plantarum]CAG2137711.1 hypothetical protein LMG26296_02592 [Cupriavidus plantarum]SMR84967.1 hypothetical protein SAMN05421735_3762 [Cupriavidus plantarum]